MINVFGAAAGLYLLIAVAVFGALAVHPANSEFRPLRAVVAAVSWLPALVFVQLSRLRGGETP